MVRRHPRSLVSVLLATLAATMLLASWMIAVVDATPGKTRQITAALSSGAHLMSPRGAGGQQPLTFGKSLPVTHTDRDLTVPQPSTAVDCLEVLHNGADGRTTAGCRAPPQA